MINPIASEKGKSAIDFRDSENYYNYEVLAISNVFTTVLYLYSISSVLLLSSSIRPWFRQSVYLEHNKIKHSLNCYYFRL